MNSTKTRGLVTESLENISQNLFKDHKEIITELVGDSSGIYALYNENELYYVGRASDLKRRVNQHLKDRHYSLWTHFSLFLIKKTDYIGDLESLLIRIAEPVGNRARPRGRDSKTLIRKLKGLIKQKHADELKELLSGRSAIIASKKAKKRTSLVGMVEKRTPIYRMHKGKEYKAYLTPNGIIHFKGKKFKAPTTAAKAIAGIIRVNGWRFWRIRNSAGDWVRLSEY